MLQAKNIFTFAVEAKINQGISRFARFKSLKIRCWLDGQVLTHKQRAGFFGDPVDELRVLDDPVEELLLSDGGAPRQVSLLVATVERDTEGKQTGPEQSGPKSQLHGWGDTFNPPR